MNLENSEKDKYTRMRYDDLNAEFNEFEPRFKSTINRFQLSAG